MAAPSDLRVLCRRLASTPVDDLPRFCPLLISHVLRCGGPLSAPSDGKAKDKSAETPMLIHKLRTHITTLLTGRNASGRFAAVCLVKAVIDVGGWESLRTADPWLRGLIGVLQKPDPLASKELSIVALTKMYMLLQAYPTLVREMATPTVPDYVKACLQLIRPPGSGRPLKVPAAFVDTVVSSLSKLVVLYPTTLRPLAAQMKAALRVYIAPTSSDAAVVPRSLRNSSRRLSVLLSYTAPKNGSSEEWARAILATILDAHATVDQVFRAVVESWESTTGYRSQTAHTGADPSGGGDAAEELPPWTGVTAGAERLIGLLEFLAEYFDSPTKAPVTVPLGEVLGLTARITLVTPPSPGTEDSVTTNPAIGRDEKAELWSVLPDIHNAALRLHHAVIRRLRENAVPLTTDILDQVVRISNASRDIPSTREITYSLAKELLLLSGPTLPRLTVDSLSPLIQSTCQDILLATDHLDDKPAPEDTKPPTNGKQAKPNPNGIASTNADAYLPAANNTTSGSSTTTSFPPLSTSHKEAATSLLPLFFSHLAQSHLAPEIRGLLDRTAILSDSKEAMLASCLHPYKDSRGRYYPSILPFLVRRYPRDQGVEVLRSNLIRIRAQQGGGDQLMDGRWDEDHDGGVNADLRDGFKELLRHAAPVPMKTETGGQEFEEESREEEDKGREKEKRRSGCAWGVDMDVDDAPPAQAEPETANPFAAVAATAGHEKPDRNPARPPSPLKRKSELVEADAGNPPKRVDTGKAAPVQQVAVMPKAMPTGELEGEGSGDESDSEGSVQIDMTLDDDDEEEEDDE